MHSRYATTIMSTHASVAGATLADQLHSKQFSPDVSVCRQFPSTGLKAKRLGRFR